MVRWVLLRNCGFVVGGLPGLVGGMVEDEVVLMRFVAGARLRTLHVAERI